MVDESTGEALGSQIVNVIDYDDEGVICFHPPAYLFLSIDGLYDLETLGGILQFTVSSNGVDFSDLTV